MIGQDYVGINTSRFFPLQNLSNQPADLVRTDRKWHINVTGAQLAMVDDFVFKESDFIENASKAGASNIKYFLASEKSLLFARGKLMLPSVSYKINNNHALAFSSNIRADGVYKSSNDEFANIFRGIEDPELLDALSNEHFKSIVNSWVEFNLSWSAVLLNTEEHLLTGGLSVKYLTGGGSGYFDMDGIEVMFDEEKIDYFKADLSYAINSNLDKAITDGDIDLFGDVGAGFDFGLSYSYLPEHLKNIKNVPYKFKVGMVVGDIGKIKHTKNVQSTTYTITIEDVPYSRFVGIETVQQLVDSLKISASFEENKSGSFSMSLPTTLTLTGDYCIAPKWYVTGMARFQLSEYYKSIRQIDQKSTRLGLTPRFENQNWGVYLPVVYDSRFDWTAGLAARWKFIFIGSGTIIGNLFSSGKGQGELYLGVNIPLGYRN